jgi:DNA gyrase subunit A
MEVGLVRSVDIDREMQQAYLDYAMSVIVARALPDARDGLKPVHRRILYAMYDMGLRPDTAYKKSARIVGEVLGKYHPHGDLTVYEAMARMAQDFSMRYLLVDGQGNFGSVDGDPPAAMRYTEARLSSLAMNMLADISKNTVDFIDNFDGSLTEPVVLPSALPDFLVNGATGIAVGMSTSVPPHNLGEVVDALKFMLERWEGLDDITVEDLMNFIQGPDFPTGGIIVQDSHDEEGLTSVYGSGRGRVIVQARAHFEEMSYGRNRIIATELPYMVNKSALIERIADLVRQGHLEGLADLRDESDRQGLRVVIELNKNAKPEVVLNELYKSTPMRSTFSIIMLALVDGEPRLLSLKQALRVYLEHRLTVVRRRSEYDLEKARQRAHILEGLRIALKNLDAVIDLIRKSTDVENARTRLMKRFRLSEMQAQAILDMPLRRLAALERKKIEDEYKEVLVQIKALEALLRSPEKMRVVVAEELEAVKDQYSDRRRTQIVRASGKTAEVSPILTPEHVVWVAITPDGMISRTSDDKPPRVSGISAPQHLVQVNTRDTLYLVSDQGEAAGIPVHALPEVGNPAEGAPVFKVSALSDQDKLAALFTLPPKEERAEGWYVFTATRQGMVKKTVLAELPGPTAKTFALVKVNEGDRLGWLRLTHGKTDILLITSEGFAIRFPEDDVRPMGLVAAGVGGIKLREKDEIVGMDILPPKGEVLLVASDGKAKRITATLFPTQGRYGQGVVAWKLPRTARLVGMVVGKPSTRLTLHLEKLASKVIRLDEVPLQTRTAQGKRIVELKVNDRLIGLTLPWEQPRPVLKGHDLNEGQEEEEQGKLTRGHRSQSPQEEDEKTTEINGKMKDTVIQEQLDFKVIEEGEKQSKTTPVSKVSVSNDTGTGRSKGRNQVELRKSAPKRPVKKEAMRRKKGVAQTTVQKQLKLDIVEKKESDIDDNTDESARKRTGRQVSSGKPKRGSKRTRVVQASRTVAEAKSGSTKDTTVGKRLERTKRKTALKKSTEASSPTLPGKSGEKRRVKPVERTKGTRSETKKVPTIGKRTSKKITTRK